MDRVAPIACVPSYECQAYTPHLTLCTADSQCSGAQCVSFQSPEGSFGYCNYGLVALPGVASSPVPFYDGMVGYRTAPQRVTLKNLGVTSTGPINLSITGLGGSTSFVIDSTTCASSLAPQQGCDVFVAYQPSSVSAGEEGFLTAQATPGGMAAVSFSGRSVAAPTDFKLSAAGVYYGETDVGQTSLAASFVLTNTGSNTYTNVRCSLPIQPTPPPGTGSCNGVTLGPGQSCTMTGTFAPASAQWFYSSAGACNISGQRIMVTASGAGVASGGLAASPNQFDFGAQAVGAGSASASFTITNSSSATLTLGAMQTTGTGQAAFGLASAMSTCASGTVLMTGDSCKLSVQFSPTAAVHYIASLVVPVLGADAGATISVTGTGT